MKLKPYEAGTVCIEIGAMKIVSIRSKKTFLSVEGNLLKSPEQVCPSPVYPVWHVHTCDPMVLVQLAFT